MRILFAAIVLLTVPGVVLAYLGFQASIPPAKPPARVIQQAAGRFDIELTLTFDVAIDEFDLERRSMLVQLGQQVLLESQESIKSGKPLVIRDVQGVAAGVNTIVVKAGVASETQQPGDEFSDGFSLEEPAASEPDALLYRAMRVRVLRDDVPVATETIWSQPGGAVEGVFDLDVPAAAVSTPAANADAEAGSS